jgi:peptidoglycan hydrolase-like protein with peptidoglycan-binding domain
MEARTPIAQHRLATMTGLGGVLLRLLVVSALMFGLLAAGSTPAHAGVARKHVIAVQKNLNRLGIYVTVDGEEGPRTRQAVCAARRLIGYKRVSRDRIRWNDVTTLRNTAALPKPRQGKNYLSVDKTCQMMYQARWGNWKRVMKVSTGAAGHRTPNGSYTFTWQWPGWHDSSQYPSDSGNGNMYNAKYFKSGGYAVHGSRSVPWYPASHGCVRISVRTADKLWNEVKIGSPIYIYGQNWSR